MRWQTLGAAYGSSASRRWTGPRVHGRPRSVRPAGSEAGGDFPPGEGLGEEGPVDLTSGGDGRHFLGAVAGGPLRWPSYRIWHDFEQPTDPGNRLADGGQGAGVVQLARRRRPPRPARLWREESGRPGRTVKLRRALDRNQRHAERPLDLPDRGAAGHDELPAEHPQTRDVVFPVGDEPHLPVNRGTSSPSQRHTHSPVHSTGPNENIGNRIGAIPLPCHRSRAASTPATFRSHPLLALFRSTLAGFSSAGGEEV